MNIVEKIGENVEHYMFHYFGVNDMSTGWELESMIKHKNDIISYYENITFEINTFDNFIDYLFLSKYSHFAEIVPYVKDEKREEVENILNFIIKKKENYKVKDLINYYTNNYRELFSSKIKGANEELVDIAIKYHSACIDVFDYLINEHYFLILYNYDRMQNILLKNNNLRKALLDEKHFEQIKFSALKYYFLIIQSFIDKGLEKILVQNIIEIIIKFGNEIYEKMNEDNVLQYEFIYKNIFDFLVKNKIAEANIYENNYKKLDSIKDNYIKKHGSEFSIKVPTDVLIKHLDDETIPWNSRLLLITHTKQDGRLRSLYTLMGENEATGLVDVICSSSTPHDDYFTVSKQDHMNMYIWLIRNILNSQLTKDKLERLISWVASMTKSDCDNLGIDYEETEFESDFNVLANMFMAINIAFDEKNIFLQTGINYGLTMYLFGLTEKILRLYYRSQKKDVYFKEDWFSLGHLLDVNDAVIIKLLGKDQIKVLAYYLINGNNGKPGFNLRNNFAHYKNIEHKNINWGVTLLALHFFINIVNEISLSFNRTTNKQ